MDLIKRGKAKRRAAASVIAQPKAGRGARRRLSA